MFVGHMAEIKKLVFSPDGKYLFSISNECDGVIIWEFMATPDSIIIDNTEIFLKKKMCLGYNNKGNDNLVWAFKEGWIA